MNVRKSEVEVEWVPLASLRAYDGNAKKHDSANVEAIANSIEEFGFRNPILAWHNEDGIAEIVAGHGRAAAARKLCMESVPVVFVDDLSDAQRRMLTLADNQTTLMTGWDEAQLAEELDALRDVFDIEDFGFAGSIADALDELEEDVKAGSLAERFGVAPFSVLNARSGEWAARKEEWLTIGIRSELGRGAAPGGVALPLNRAGGGA